MRNGENIVRDKLVEVSKSSHRVIIPVYIPNEEGYYKDAYKVFEICVSSILKTSNSPVKISIISNGSSDAINTKIASFCNTNAIDELIITTSKIGKINSILKCLRHSKERLITITDADVLFLNNWEQAIVDVFNAFPKAGMVSPVPMYRTQLRLTSNIWLRYFFSNTLKFRPVKNPEALERFAKSVGWPNLSNKMKDVALTLKSKSNIIAYVGNSHFVGTYKNEVFKQLPKEDSLYKLGGNSEFLYLDEPVLKVGGYRLATYNNYAYHLGNKLEDWAEETFKTLEDSKKEYNDYDIIPKLSSSSISYFISEKIFKKLFYIKSFKRFAYKRKGLNKEQLHNFTNSDFL
ncbi:glycosyltransferase family A protein [uncultured Lacinutrix sp.]|uniref:glycosyltransferase family A protein n=1 Tax=uncultured Lacinutrix sp. TaxID=574032 RepID=UPI00262B1FA9|nr:glycosyltransferase family 2 protein [uncultured Lacinutrix sp.]